VVIITSNNEKELPDAFLRRCFFHYIRFPDAETLAPSSRCIFPASRSAAGEALTQFYELREVPGLKKKPSTSEVLDWLKLLLAEDLGPEDLRATAALPRLHGALLKNEQDVQLFERLAFMARGQRCQTGSAMRHPLFLAALCALAACAPPAQVSKNRPPVEVGVGFGAPSDYRALAAASPGSSLTRDFMDLTFAMESGRALETFSRFEGPVTVAMRGAAPASAAKDLAGLIGRLRSEAGIDISPRPARRRSRWNSPRGRTCAVWRRRRPVSWCRTCPRWPITAASAGRMQVDWATVTRRERAVIFIPADTSPQEVRDCLHEELAQALGPLNDLYRLSDSVFNDDNFHSVLTAFDMDILRMTYSPTLAAG
jgi:hypothetical protein